MVLTPATPTARRVLGDLARRERGLSLAQQAPQGPLSSVAILSHTILAQALKIRQPPAPWLAGQPRAGLGLSQTAVALPPRTACAAAGTANLNLPGTGACELAAGRRDCCARRSRLRPCWSATTATAADELTALVLLQPRQDGRMEIGLVVLIETGPIGIGRMVAGATATGQFTTCSLQ